MDNLQHNLDQFKRHYAQQFSDVQSEQMSDEQGLKKEFIIKSDLLKPGNYPFILHHNKTTRDAIVLVHGLTDSPYYMRAIGERFLAEGLNVVLPLLPAHGLISPDKAMEDKQMDSKWKAEVDTAVDIAHQLGERVSLGGFSTGGALSYNKVLRDPKSIDGCLFLFSAALELGFVDELADVTFIQTIFKFVDRKYKGTGANPYKYPAMSRFAGMELAQIIEENEKLEARKIISQPVFAAHSIHDRTVKIEGILRLLEKYVKKGIGFFISENVQHEEVVLAKNIPLDLSNSVGHEKEPQANPEFKWMMDNAFCFFEQCGFSM